MKHYFELKGVKDEINNTIALFVNSGYMVYWKTVKTGNTKRKVLVIDDGKEEEK